MPSLARRVLTSFLGGHNGRWAGGRRAREGYGLARRCLASFLRVELPPQQQEHPASIVRPVAAMRRPGSNWFGLPLFPPETGLTLTAASPGRVAAALSPEGTVEFSLYHNDSTAVPRFSLEIVLRGPTSLPAIVRVAYRLDEDQATQTDLLIPVTDAPLGPPTSRVELPGFAAGIAWESNGLIGPSEAISLGEPVIRMSIAAAASEGTLVAWRRLRAVGGALADAIDQAWE